MCVFIYLIIACSLFYTSIYCDLWLVLAFNCY